MIGMLHGSMQKYLDRLEKQQDKNKQYHSSQEPVRSLKDNWELRLLPVGEVPVRPDLMNTLNSSANYQVINLEEYLPFDRVQVKDFIQNLTLPFKTQLLTYAFGNSLGNVYFIWKCEKEDEAAKVSAVKYVLDHLPNFSTRAMRTFLDRYKREGYSKKVMRDMWSF